MKIKKKLSDLTVYYLVLYLLKAFRLIPRRTGIAMMRGLSILFYLFSSKHKKNIIRHLTLAFGEEKSKKEIKRLARKVFLHFATAGVDAIRIPIFIKNGMDRYIKADNMHYLENAYKNGKGMILLTGHFGNWELMGAWLAWKKYPLHVVGASNSNPRLKELIVKERRNDGYVSITRAKETRKIIKTLKKGYPLGILIDQDTRVKGVFVDFFNKKANTPIGPILLARRYNVPIIPLFMHIEKDLTYHVECFKPLVLSDTGDTEKDILADAQQCNDMYEKIIREHPEQWVWMHRRWKRRPKKNIQISAD